ncbi:MAG: glycosyltransferase [Helicobacteraceae bacterium]|jgi:glycosyltransferase involved in cell wall biosynthesis|nr:glycosyltransferase [Helicobacteraceae bacterium]
MKIAFLTNDAREESGGAFLSQKSLIEALNDLGHEAYMIATKTRGGEKEQSFRITYLNARGDFGRVLALRKMVLSERPDALIASMNPQIVLCALAKIITPCAMTKFCGIVRMGNLCLKYAHSLRFVPFRLLQSLLFGKLDAAIAVSNFAARDLQKAYYLKTLPVTLYNPIDSEVIALKATEYAPQMPTNTLINIGRLANQKAQHLLVLAAAKLRDMRSDWHLIIMGADGVNKANILKAIAQNGLEEFVTIMPFHSNPFPYLKQSKLFLLSSKYEGFGRVVAESMALKVPVVAFRAPGGGHIELLEDGRGFLVEWEDTDALAVEINTLLDSPDLCAKTAEKAYDFVLSLAPKRIAARLIEIIGGDAQ